MGFLEKAYLANEKHQYWHKDNLYGICSSDLIISCYLWDMRTSVKLPGRDLKNFQNIKLITVKRNLDELRSNKANFHRLFPWIHHGRILLIRATISDALLDLFLNFQPRIFNTDFKLLKDTFKHLSAFNVHFLRCFHRKSSLISFHFV